MSASQNLLTEPCTSVATYMYLDSYAIHKSTSATYLGLTIDQLINT